jgi:AraC family transcriptional regulator
VPEQPSDFAYKKRFDAVLAYIDANLEGDLSVKALSDVANFSVYHSIGSSRRSWACPFHAMCS